MMTQFNLQTAASNLKALLRRDTFLLSTNDLALLNGEICRVISPYARHGRVEILKWHQGGGLHVIPPPVRWNDQDRIMIVPPFFYGTTAIDGTTINNQYRQSSWHHSVYRRQSWNIHVSGTHVRTLQKYPLLQRRT
jgi:hypothetical protein